MVIQLELSPAYLNVNNKMKNKKQKKIKLKTNFEETLKILVSPKKKPKNQGLFNLKLG